MKGQEALLDLIGKRILLLDGAMGSMLLAAGLREGEVPELWNLEKPEVIRNIHQSYYRAGSDIVQTNTFGGSRIKLGSSGKGDLVVEVNTAAARLVREVCPEGRFVAGDIGPTGKFLKPMGKYEYEDFRRAFAEQARHLAEGGVDLFHIETMYDVNEALAALEGVRSVSDLPVFASMTFKRTPRGFFTIMGNRPVPSLVALAGKGAAVVGSNCTLTGSEMGELIGEIRMECPLPLVVQPNAGQPEMKDGKIHYPEGPGDFADHIKKILALGVQVIGGCCGTTPETIEVLRSLIDSNDIRCPA